MQASVSAPITSSGSTASAQEHRSRRGRQIAPTVFGRGAPVGLAEQPAEVCRVGEAPAHADAGHRLVAPPVIDERRPAALQPPLTDAPRDADALGLEELV